MNRILASAAFAAASLVATVAQAQTTVNFDQGTDPTIYRSQGLVINGFEITSNTFGGAVIVPSSPNYAAVGFTSSFGFVDPTSGAATTANNFGVTIPGLDLGGGFYAGGTLNFFGATGVLLGSQFFAPVGPNEFRGPIQYRNNLQNISSVQFTRTENPAGFGALFPIDDVTFTLNAATGAVPEPASWAMMIGGFGLVGGAMRRKVRVAKVSFAA